MQFARFFITLSSFYSLSTQKPRLFCIIRPSFSIPSKIFLVFSHRFVCIKKRFKLFSSNLFFFKKQRRTFFKDIPVLLNDLSGLFVTLIHDSLHFLVNHSRNALTVRLGMSQIPSDEDFIVITAIVDEASSGKMRGADFGRSCQDSERGKKRTSEQGEGYRTSEDY